MLKKAIIAIVALVFLGLVIICALAAMQPADFRIERSTVIEASPDRVFAQVNDFHNWESWSPWVKLDPAMTTNYSGPQSGVGATYRWKGNSDVGEGNMTITESRPAEHIAIDLEFKEPFAARNMTEFGFKPAGNKTAVTWTMTGKNNFIAKAFGLFVNMDKLVGGDFDKGLNQLKNVVEASKENGK